MADAMTSLALTKKEAKSAMGTASSPGDAPKYEWGTRIELSTRSLDKLKIKELPKVGSYVTVTARCCVTSVSESQQVDGDENRCVSLQIEDMSVAPEKAMRGSAKRSSKPAPGTAKAPEKSSHTARKRSGGGY